MACGAARVVLAATLQLSVACSVAPSPSDTNADATGGTTEVCEQFELHASLELEFGSGPCD